MTMQKRKMRLRRTCLASAIAGLVYAAGATAGREEAASTRPYDGGALATADSLRQVEARNAGSLAAREATVLPGLYIVQLVDPPAAQNPSLPQQQQKGGRADLRSAPATEYADQLRLRQQQLLESVSQRFGGASALMLESYQYAFNGFVGRLSADGLEYLRKHPSVRNIEPVTVLPLDTDSGPSFIGADAIWSGSATGGAPGTSGEGVVIGIIDSGVNWESPSFADVGGDAYDHSNPLGSGNYLGICATQPADADVGPNCNDKVIGAYAKSFDFVQQVNFECANPDDPGNELGLTPATCASIAVPLVDFPNAQDENGHGSHTASTSGGNVTAINYRGNPLTVSGVAPHANLVIYDTCHTNSNSQGSCFNFATLGAIEQAVVDGVVDVINYSIGGGSNPWAEANSQAFLAAADSGIFVAASAGNSGPGPATTGHREPWVATSAASSHTRAAINYMYSANGAVLPPAGVTNQTMFLGSVGGPHDEDFDDEAVVISPDLDTAANPPTFLGDGCAPYPADTFLDAVAVVRRGGCAFADKATNAVNAGAIGVIVANNTTGNIAPGVSPTVAVPVFGITQAQGNALRDYVNDPGNGGAATIDIPLGAPLLATQGDVIAGFSSRGPSPFEAMKPDITNPGVNILAAYVGGSGSPSQASDPGAYEQISGTSMSSPHTAGSAALVRAVHPDWSPSEIKSALMLTAKRSGITKEDGLTTADPFDRGAGRVNLAVAAETGLVMDEQTLDYFGADPSSGGDPSTLNLASLQSNSCVGTCSWTRTFRSVASVPITYNASFQGAAGVDVSVTPSTFTIAPGHSVTLEFEADVTAATPGEYHFGDVVIAPEITSYTETVSPGSPITIPDGLYTGQFDAAGVACVGFDLSGDVTGNVADASVELAIDHTWIGDLVVKLSTPGGTILGLMSRPGENEGADDGDDAVVGDSSNLQASSPVTFADTATASAEAMGSGIAGAQVACQDDGVCSYAPAPGSITQPPSSFAGLAGENAEGTWTLCVGDSVAPDAGNLTSASLTVTTESPPVPAVHLPLAAFAVLQVPQVEVTPAAVSETAVAGGAIVEVPVEIANVGTASLDWAEDAAATVMGAPLYSQLMTLADNPGSGFSTGTYTAAGGNGVYLSDSFTLAADAAVGGLYVDGFVFAATPALAYQTVSFHVFPDAGGEPAGDPQSSPEAAVWSYTTTLGDLGLVEDEGPFAGSISLDLTQAGESLQLTAGKYWLVVAPEAGAPGGASTDEWFWLGTGPNLNLDDSALLIDPGNLFGGNFTSWTNLESLLSPPNNARFRGLSLEVSGTEACGAPWLSSTPVDGQLAPGASEEVTLMLDPAALAPGEYQALYCVVTNDPGTPVAATPVTFAVTDIPTDLSVDASATPTTLDVGQSTLFTAVVTPATEPASTDIAVTADLTPLGGSAAQVLYDDGTNGDATGGDNVFSLNFTVQASATYAAHSITVTAEDGEDRSAQDGLTITVQPSGTLIFSDGFED